ncbi:MAG: holo-ACP synthase [Treponema sp.]
MIFGVGADIAEVRRFEKWAQSPELMERFFHAAELPRSGTLEAKSRRLAARFAAKEAFSKALGTGIRDFSLKEVWIENDGAGKPELRFSGSAEKLLRRLCGDCAVFVSLSHEKEYALAFVVIERVENEARAAQAVVTE